MAKEYKARFADAPPEHVDHALVDHLLIADHAVIAHLPPLPLQDVGRLPVVPSLVTVVVRSLQTDLIGRGKSVCH